MASTYSHRSPTRLHPQVQPSSRNTNLNHNRLLSLPPPAPSPPPTPFPLGVPSPTPPTYRIAPPFTCPLLASSPPRQACNTSFLYPKASHVRYRRTTVRGRSPDLCRPPAHLPPAVLFPRTLTRRQTQRCGPPGRILPRVMKACRQQIDGSKMLGFDGELRVNRHRRRRRRRKTKPVRTTPPSPEPKTPRRRSSSLFPFPPSPPSTPLLPLPPQESPPRYEIVKRHHLVFFFVFLGRLLLPGPVFPGPPVTSGPRRRFAPPSCYCSSPPQALHQPGTPVSAFQVPERLADR